MMDFGEKNLWKRFSALVGVMIALLLYIHIVQSFQLPTTPFQQLITVILWAVPTVAMIGAVINGDDKSISTMLEVAIAVPLVSLLFTYLSSALTPAIPTNATGMEAGFASLAKLFFKDGLALVLVLIPALNSIIEGFSSVKEIIKR